MPVMDGYTLLRFWKADAHLKHVPFIVYTATYTAPEDERLALSLGADAFILKPAEPDDFLAQIRRVEAHGIVGPATSPQIQISTGDEKELLKVYRRDLIRKLEEKTCNSKKPTRRCSGHGPTCPSKRKMNCAENPPSSESAGGLSLDGILVVDSQGRKILQNQRMRDLWKIPLTSPMVRMMPHRWISSPAGRRPPGSFPTRVACYTRTRTKSPAMKFNWWTERF